jgi:hypothetical protein
VGATWVLLASFIGCAGETSNDDDEIDAAISTGGIEGEALAFDSADGKVISDAKASGLKALELSSTAAASRSTSVSAMTTQVTVTARGEQCNGAPNLEVIVDRTQVMSVAVSATTWTQYVGAVELTPGYHWIQVKLTNDYRSTSCDRNLFVDKINLGAPAPGAGKAGYGCPPGAVTVGPSDNIVTKVTGAAAGAVICIQGEHRVTAPLVPKAHQTWIGTDTNARISGAASIGPWYSYGSGVWYYDGPYAKITPHKDPYLYVGGPMTYYDFTQWEDDLFYRPNNTQNDVRIMRVLTLAEVYPNAPLDTTPFLPAAPNSPKIAEPGQVVTDGEVGRFFFDDVHGRIYTNLDPTKGKLDLAVATTVVQGTSGAVGVSLQNLFIEKALDTAIIPYGLSWSLTDVTIRFAHKIGITLKGQYGDGIAPFQVQRSLITNNGMYGMAIDGPNVIVKDCELSWNNIANYRTDATYFAAGAAKMIRAQGISYDQPALELINMNSHHNIGSGWWNDVGEDYVIVWGGRFHHNESEGFFGEISCHMDVSAAELDHNGLFLKNKELASSAAGVSLSDSNYSYIHSNVIHDNAAAGVKLRWVGHSAMRSAACLGAATDSDITGAMVHNLVQYNSIYECAGASGAVYWHEGQTRFKLDDRYNYFNDNDYYLSSATQRAWVDEGQSFDWNTWRSLGHDAGGRAVAGCSP